MAEIIYDATVVFCNRFIDRCSRTHDQMVQAARSGKQNIAEGCMASGISKKTELKLIGVARASLEELLLELDEGTICKDFLPAQLKGNRRVERRQLPYKNIFVVTVSLNATKLGGWVV